MRKIIGVIYPVPKNLVDRLLVRKRNVFVKYLPRTTNISLKPRDKVLFYASHADKQVVGEGKAEKIEFLTPEEALQTYGDKIFLSKDELISYMTSQPKRDSSKKMLVILLSDLKKFKKSIPYGRPITMAGEYLSKERYTRLLGSLNL